MELGYSRGYLGWGAVDTFDEFLEPLAGPRAGRNGVSASNILSCQQAPI